MPRDQRQVHPSLAILGVIAVLTVAAAQAPPEEEPALPTGPFYLEDTLVVGPGETLRVLGGTSITGPGRIEVWGTLRVTGEPGRPAEVGVPVLLLGNATGLFENARVWGVNGTALTATGGELVLRDVVIEGAGRGLLAGGEARVLGERLTLRDNPGEALYVQERADVRIDAASFERDGRGVTVFSARRFELSNSTFSDNGQHLVVDLGAWSDAGVEVALRDNTLAAPARHPGGLPAILLRHGGAEGAASTVVTLARNRVEDAPTGLRAEGPALVVESLDDAFVGNVVGVSVQHATVRLVGTTLGNDEDVVGQGAISFDRVTYLSPSAGAPAAVDAPPAAPRVVLPWQAIGLGTALVALGLAAAVLVPRVLRTDPPEATTPFPRVVAAAPEPADEPPEPAPEPPAEPAAPALPDLADLKPQERRILEDVLAHPGTSQREVADRLGVTRQALHYHVKKLEARRLLVKTPEGRETRCSVPFEVAAALSAPAVTQPRPHEAP